MTRNPIARPTRLIISHLPVAVFFSSSNRINNFHSSHRKIPPRGRLSSCGGWGRGKNWSIRQQTALPLISKRSFVAFYFSQRLAFVRKRRRKNFPWDDATKRREKVSAYLKEQSTMRRTTGKFSFFRGEGEGKQRWKLFIFSNFLKTANIIILMRKKNHNLRNFISVRRRRRRSERERWAKGKLLNAEWNV